MSLADDFWDETDRCLDILEDGKLIGELFWYSNMFLFHESNVGDD